MGGYCCFWKVNLHISLFLVQSPGQYSQIEEDAVRLSEEIKAEYWAVSALSGQ